MHGKTMLVNINFLKRFNFVYLTSADFLDSSPVLSSSTKVPYALSIFSLSFFYII
ncbi:MAG TPA: hypothetical protein PLE16_04470 [Spirochaetota bacterium]|nr:hypothetical protein [Spirochaetota bacterium]HQA51816.1 hypothetical protein [Spirochaetota bacterium]